MFFGSTTRPAIWQHVFSLKFVFFFNFVRWKKCFWITAKVWEARSRLCQTDFCKWRLVRKLLTRSNEIYNICIRLLTRSAFAHVVFVFLGGLSRLLSTLDSNFCTRPQHFSKHASNYVAIFFLCNDFSKKSFPPDFTNCYAQVWLNVVGMLHMFSEDGKQYGDLQNFFTIFAKIPWHFRNRMNYSWFNSSFQFTFSIW